MSDDTRPSREAHQTALLARIADALGLPTSCFYADGEAWGHEGAKQGHATVLALVQSYLQVASPVARRDFVEAVKAIADDLPL